MQERLFVIDLTYVSALTEVDRLLEPHRAFLSENYAAGHFIVSGPKEPRTGGIILARASSLEMVEQLIEADPFKKEGVAIYNVTEFLPAMAADGFLNASQQE